MTKLRKDSTQAIMDGFLKFLIAGGVVTTALAAPNAVQIFDKPLNKLLKNLDAKAREREIRRVMYYMKRKGFIHYSPYDYEHGIKLTSTGKKYLKQRRIDSLEIKKPHSWDKRWRLVFFDIPEEKRNKRKILTNKLRLLNFQQLQYSIWIHPFPCRDVVEAITEANNIRPFVSYVEIEKIDNDRELRDRFHHLLK